MHPHCRPSCYRVDPERTRLAKSSLAERPHVGGSRFPASRYAGWALPVATGRTVSSILVANGSCGCRLVVAHQAHALMSGPATEAKGRPDSRTFDVQGRVLCAAVAIAATLGGSVAAAPQADIFTPTDLVADSGSSPRPLIRCWSMVGDSRLARRARATPSPQPCSGSSGVHFGSGDLRGARRLTQLAAGTLSSSREWEWTSTLPVSARETGQLSSASSAARWKAV